MNQEYIAAPTGLIQSTPEFSAICMNIAELEQSLLNQDPRMPEYLRDIHAALGKHAELTHMISAGQRATVIEALMKHTSTLLVTQTTAAAGRSKAKALTKHSEEDI